LLAKIAAAGSQSTVLILYYDITIFELTVRYCRYFGKQSDVVRYLKTFMRKQVAILISCFVILSACTDYQNSPTSAGAVQNLNKQLEAGRLNNDNWTSSPEDIVRHLFPAVSHDSGPKRYEITKASTSNEACSVTVLEEGAIDDEVLGERRTIEFQKITGKWNIIGYQYAAKRRD